MPAYVLGIDVGTGGTRAVIVDDLGRVAASATEDHEPFASPNIGWAEQHPEDWWRATGVAVRKALAQAALRNHQIACAGFSGQMHGAVMLELAGLLDGSRLDARKIAKPAIDALGNYFGILR